MPEIESPDEKPQFTPSISPEEELEGLRAGKLPNNDRTYLMAHAANAEIDKTESAIDPQTAAEGAGQLYDLGVTNREYNYILQEGLSVDQREKLAKALHPEGEEQKYYDAMTGLSNRNAYENAKERVETDAQVQHVIVDLDDLKLYNDSMGHKAGDDFIRNAARWLIRVGLEFGIDTHSLFRWGGDEFVALVPADKVESFEARLHEVFKNWTTGVGQTLDEADEKLYENKQAKKGSSGDEPEPYKFREI